MKPIRIVPVMLAVLFLAIAGRGSRVQADTDTTKDYPITIDCAESQINIGYCDSSEQFQVNTSGTLKVQFIATSGVCSSLRLSVDLTNRVNTGTMSLNETSGIYELGPVTAGSHDIIIQGEARCTATKAIRWSGIVRITTSTAAPTSTTPGQPTRTSGITFVTPLPPTVVGAAAQPSPVAANPVLFVTPVVAPQPAAVVVPQSAPVPAAAGGTVFTGIRPPSTGDAGLRDLQGQSVD